jgi:hypothetical protein
LGYYSLETATADASVAFYEKMFQVRPNDQELLLNPETNHKGSGVSGFSLSLRKQGANMTVKNAMKKVFLFIYVRNQDLDW